MSISVVVLVSVVGLATLYYQSGTPGSGNSAVQIDALGLGWASPPHPVCSESTLSYTVQPGVPFTVSTGTPFNVSYKLICTLNATASAAAYVIYGAAAASPGITLITSNVPVGVGTSEPSWLNVTVETTDPTMANSVSIQISTETFPVSYG